MSLGTNTRNRLTGRTVHIIIDRYIPQKLLKSVKFPEGTYQNEDDIVETMLSNSDNMLRMYGSAQELLLNLKIFHDFPLSHRCFGFDPKEPYNTISYMYKNMDGVPFLNKADMYCQLESVDIKQFKNPHTLSLFLSMESILFKSHEERIVGVCEYIKYDMNWMYKLQIEFGLFQKEILAQKSYYTCDNWNYEEAMKMFKTLLPVWNEQKYCEFKQKLKDFFDLERGHFDDINLAIQSLASYLNYMIPKNPETFLPYDKETNPNCPIVVRVFYSHGFQFVMKSELFNAINIRNPDSKRLEWKDIDGKIMTMSYEKVQRKYKDRIGNIEFIKCPIQRTDHKAVPIMTPSGGHCILAADFLFEFLNELIFTHRIFQKKDNLNWNVLRRFFLCLPEFFSPHHKSIYFVTLEEQDQQKKELMNFWKNFEHFPAKHVRNAKKDGFTVQNLKNELANLGLTEKFPEIQDYAEAVYSEVFKAKKEEFLRTCDLFKAVEKCLLICIFKRFSSLRLYLHTQNACHLLPALECSFCISPNDNQFKNTNWKEPNYKETLSKHVSSNPENIYLYEITLPDGTKLTNSFYEFFDKEQIRKHNVKYFIYDQQDLIHFAKNSKNLKSQRIENECRYSLDAFQKFYPDKKLYIRTIPSMRWKRDETKRVFTEEVLDLIPVVLRQQNTPISDNDDRLAKYRKKWETNNKSLESTINLTEFWYILEEFDVDKTRITIVPDPVHELTMPKMIKELTMRTLNVISPRGEQVMRFEQAVYHIFEVVYCGVNWETDSCREHEDCLKELKNEIAGSMRTYSQMDEGTYVTVEHVESTIKQLKNHCSFQLQSNTPSPLAELQNKKFDDMISKEELVLNSRKFGLTKIIPALNRLEPFTKAIEVRNHYLSAWIDKLLYFDTVDLFYLIHDESGFRSFAVVKDIASEDIQKTLFSSVDHIQNTSPIEKIPTDGINQSKNCVKCSRTSEMCNEAKKELKMTQNRLEKYEKKARRTDEVEKELKALKLETKKKEKEMKERELEMEKKEKENEELKMKVSRLEANETRMRLNEKNHSIHEKEQSERIDELTARFEHQKEIVQLMELQIQQNEERLKLEIREKERGFEELRAALTIMSNEKESIQIENRNLRERIASIPEAPPTPTVPKPSSDGPTHHRFALLGFQKIKDSLYHKKQLKQAKEMIEKLKSSSNLVEIHQIADYEYYQFEWNLLKYTKEVELNIQKIKETCDVSTVTQLPDSPEFSHRFMNLYWRIINNQSITSSEIEVSDSECFICTEEMAPDQKTLECEECKKVTHFECASQWLKIHRSCPHCRREMLEPEEFPNLGQ